MALPEYFKPWNEIGLHVAQLVTTHKLRDAVHKVEYIRPVFNVVIFLSRNTYVTHMHRAVYATARCVSTVRLSVRPRLVCIEMAQPVTKQSDWIVT